MNKESRIKNHNSKFVISNSNRGFTLFFAMLTASLVLAVGLAIYDLTVREIDLSGASTQSQYAIYAADTGAECALYWDYNYTGNYSGSAFATSTLYMGAGGGAGLWCNGQDITLQGPPAADAARYDPGCTQGAWCHLPGPGTNAATTTFRVTFAQPYCAVVQVGKYTNASGILYTTVISRGYNTCAAGATRFERALQLAY